MLALITDPSLPLMPTLAVPHCLPRNLDGYPPMFFFADPDGNGLVYLEEEPGEA